MSLGNPITIRLSAEKQLFYEDAASRRGQGLSTYLRERLEEADTIRDQLSTLRNELAVIRHKVENLAGQNIEGGSGMAEADRAALIEALLLLRHLCKPEQHNEVRADLRRFGITMWSAEAANV